MGPGLVDNTGISKCNVQYAIGIRIELAILMTLENTCISDTDNKIITIIIRLLVVRMAVINGG